MEAKGGPSQMTARVCLPRYRALLQRFMKATTENQQAKMAFKGASVDRLAQQARMMRQFDGVRAAAILAQPPLWLPLTRYDLLVLPRLRHVQHDSLLCEYMRISACPMRVCVCVLHVQHPQQSDDDLREELERDPDLITKTVQRMAHGEVMAEYAMAQQKEQVRNTKLLWLSSVLRTFVCPVTHMTAVHLLRPSAFLYRMCVS